jgi:hypothetical protein
MSFRKSDQKTPGVPWYAKLLCRRRLAVAKGLATELAAKAAARWESLGLPEANLPVEWRTENLVATLFRSLNRDSADQVRDDWLNILKFLDRFSIDQGGRESTCKGSIGHDRLNVKTLSPGEWKRWVAAAFTREMKPWSPCPQTFRLSNDHSSSAVTELPV